MLRVCRSLLRFLLEPDRFEDTIGDLEERHARLVERDGRVKADGWYAVETLLIVLRPPLLRVPAFQSLRGFSNGLQADVRFAFRMVRREPVTSTAIVLTLGVAIGAMTAVISVADRVLMRVPPGLEAPDRLVEVYSRVTESRRGAGLGSYWPFARPVFETLVTESTMLEGAAAVSPGWMLNVVVDDQGERLEACFVTANYFDLVGAPLAFGRDFESVVDAAAGAAPIAVLSHAYWNRRFGADLRVLGRSVWIEGRQFTVVGVTRRGFVGTSAARAPDIWLPTSMMEVIPVWGRSAGTAGMYIGVARIRHDVELPQVQAELEQVSAEAYPAGRRTFNVVPLDQATVDPNQRGVFLNTAMALAAGVSAILLIACLNVAGILLARSVGRRRELAVRVALGAGRGRLIRQLLTESSLLFVAGAAAGLVLLLVLRTRFASVQPPARFFFSSPSLELPFDAQVALFAFIITGVAATSFGLLPAVRASRTDPRVDLHAHETGQGKVRWRMRDVLVVLQVAFCLLILAGAGLFVRALNAARNIDPGFDAERIGMLSVTLHHPDFTPERQHGYYRRVLEVARSVPGVEQAALTRQRPLEFGDVAAARRHPDVPPEQDFTVRPTQVTAGYFETLGIPLIAGRGFLPTDDRATETTEDERRYVVIINETTAALAWPGEAVDRVVGRRLYGAFGVGGSAEVIGVVPTTRQISLGEEPTAAVYTSLEQRSRLDMATLLFRTRGDPREVLATVAARIRAIDPTVPVHSVQPASALVARALWGARASASFLTTLAMIGAFLAAVGVYGIVSSMVGEQRRAMAIRIALGARRERVHRLVMGRALAIVGLGMLIGLAAVLAAGRTIASLLYGVPPHDPPTLAAVATGLLAIATIAAYVPSRRATRVDPLEILRGD